ncbi:MAG: hypothetical protein JWP51_1737 [Bradyrhizobium sp.]|jgi:hypothetical protein|nr:hypothetical protein [Bradyrhizobium sp.]
MKRLTADGRSAQVIPVAVNERIGASGDAIEEVGRGYSGYCHLQV